MVLVWAASLVLLLYMYMDFFSAQPLRLLWAARDTSRPSQAVGNIRSGQINRGKEREKEYWEFFGYTVSTYLFCSFPRSLNIYRFSFLITVVFVFFFYSLKFHPLFFFLLIYLAVPVSSFLI